MPLRQHMDSDQDQSDPDAGDQGFEEEDEEPEEEEESTLGEPKFQRAKQLFIDLLDSYEEHELGRVTFKYVFSNSALHVINEDGTDLDKF